MAAQTRTPDGTNKPTPTLASEDNSVSAGLGVHPGIDEVGTAKARDGTLIVVEEEEAVPEVRDGTGIVVEEEVKKIFEAAVGVCWIRVNVPR